MEILVQIYYNSKFSATLEGNAMRGWWTVIIQEKDRWEESIEWMKVLAMLMAEWQGTKDLRKSRKMLMKEENA